MFSKSSWFQHLNSILAKKFDKKMVVFILFSSFWVLAHLVFSAQLNSHL